MIDLHNHILPSIDDGARDLKEAFQLEELLLQQGVDTVVCTPHFDPTKTSLKNFAQLRAASIALMEASRLQLIAASETVLHEYLLHYTDLNELCIMNTKYLLIELPFNDKWTQKNWELLQTIITHYDITPIIAHIERYPAIRRQEKSIQKLRELGCIIQVNTSSIMDPKQWRRIRKYLKQGVIDVLGSDCHNPSSRPPTISEAVSKLRLTLGDAFLLRLEKNAQQIINGIPPERGNSFLIE